jgi:high-affinity iron transporter
MFSAFLIMLRETLEAVLVIGVLLGFLARTGRKRHARGVIWGAAAGVGASILGAILFNALAGGFEGRGEQIFEGVTMLAGSLLMITMIVWFAAQGADGDRLEKRAGRLSDAGGLGLFFLAAVSVLREGVESVLFVAAAGYQAEGGLLAGAALGFAAALLIGIGFFTISRRVRLSTIFLATNILLLLFGAGLASSSMHEFAEAGVLPSGIEHVWDVNPPPNPDGSFPLLHENGTIGGILKGLFGWRGSPSLVEIVVYLLFAACAATMWIWAARRRVPND